MSRPDRRTYRVANVVLEQFCAVPARNLAELEESTSSVVYVIDRLKALRHRLKLCRERGFFAAGTRVRNEATHLLNALTYETEAAIRLAEAPRRSMPTLRDVVSELEQLQDEFGEWQYHGDEQSLIVVTEPIELEGLYLGPFEIKLFLQDLDRADRIAPYCVSALDPHPAAMNEEVTHPHVSGDMLCAGDASAAIKATLMAGRLCEFFLLVRSVLMNYNPESPFVSLDDWYAQPCFECGCPLSEDDRYWCERCEQDFCDQCTRTCNCCDRIVCRGCARTCPVCDEPVCDSCMSTCEKCGADCCVSCLDDDLCPTCKESMEENDEGDERQSDEQSAQEIPASHSISAIQEAG
jgi:hypothetical protein